MKENSKKVLFIGNSHTYFNDMPYIFQEICKNNGIDMSVFMLAHGGMGFDFHAQQPEVSFNILHGNYDYVVLQHKAHPFDSENEMLLGARELNKIIEKTNTKAILYMTWSEKGNEAGQVPMADAYFRLGNELNMEVAPVGIVWQKYRNCNKDEELYFTDGEHASIIGSTLAAYTIFSTIFKKQAIPLKTSENALAAAAFEKI